MHREFGRKTQRGYLEDMAEVGRIILRYILRKHGVWMHGLTASGSR